MEYQLYKFSTDRPDKWVKFPLWNNSLEHWMTTVFKDNCHLLLRQNFGIVFIAESWDFCHILNQWVRKAKFVQFGSDELYVAVKEGDTHIFREHEVLGVPSIHVNTIS